MRRERLIQAGKAGCAIGCFAAFLLLAVASPFLMLPIMLWLSSERTIYSRAVSPDEAREARVQFDDCGAACAWSKSVFVKSAWLSSDSRWLSCHAFRARGVSGVELEWRGNARLVIRHGFPAKEVVGWNTSCGPVVIEVKYDMTLAAEEL